MVSVCILNWNCVSTLKTTIAMLLTTIRFPFEVIVYDQASTDGSREFLSGLNHEKVRSILSDRNVGNSVSRNEMVRAAKYKYVLLLDSDIVPIPGSIEAVCAFMEREGRFAFVGYDFKKYSEKWEETTRLEEEIKSSDVRVMGSQYKYRIALTQYGLFKRECLLEFPFPEFYPFDREGWGAEDDFVGQAIVENQSKFGTGGVIVNRVYFHNKSSSVKQMGEDTFGRMYMKRFAYLKYFDMFMNPQQKLEALKNQKLPTTKLPCNQYHWADHRNLGDLATLSAFKENFPFFEFDRDEKKKLLMFGGTIFNHVKNANRTHGADFKKILYFGVGVSRQAEIDDALRVIKEKDISFLVVPRGPKTREMLAASGVPCEDPCGDVLQLVASLPASETDGDAKNIKIVSAYGTNDFDVDNHIPIRVSNDKKKNLEVPFVSESDFFEMLERHNEVHSSQVHPFFISAMLGTPCRLHPLDWRAEDFGYFPSFKLHMSAQESADMRRDAQKNSQKFILSFYKQLRWLCE